MRWNWSGPEGDTPLFSDVWQTKDFKSNEFGCVAKKGFTERFFGCVARKGVSGLEWLFTEYYTIVVNRCQEQSMRAMPANLAEMGRSGAAPLRGELRTRSPSRRRARTIVPLRGVVGVGRVFVGFRCCSFCRKFVSQCRRNASYPRRRSKWEIPAGRVLRRKSRIGRILR